MQLVVQHREQFVYRAVVRVIGPPYACGHSSTQWEPGATRRGSTPAQSGGGTWGSDEVAPPGRPPPPRPSPPVIPHDSVSPSPRTFGGRDGSGRVAGARAAAGC